MALNLRFNEWLKFSKEATIASAQQKKKLSIVVPSSVMWVWAHLTDLFYTVAFIPPLRCKIIWNRWSTNKVWIVCFDRAQPWGKANEKIGERFYLFCLEWVLFDKLWICDWGCKKVDHFRWPHSYSNGHKTTWYRLFGELSWIAVLHRWPKMAIPPLRTCNLRQRKCTYSHRYLNTMYIH